MCTNSVRAIVRTLAVAGAAAITTACGRGTPVSPDMTGGLGDPSVRLELVTPGSVAPGESVQLVANLLGPGGAVEDVSARATWTIRSATAPGVLLLSATGVATGGERGQSVVTARFDARTADATLDVLPIRDYRGTYTLIVTTMEDGRYCPLVPEELSRRVYTGTVVQSGTELTVSLSGADFVTSGSGPTFRGAVGEAGEITFQLRPASIWDYDGPDVVERLRDGTEICMAGTLVAGGTATGVSGTASSSYGATIYRCSGTYVVHGGCPIARFELVRQ